MKTRRIFALTLVLVIAVSLITIAQADETPSTWLSDTLVEIHIMRDENPSQLIQLDNVKLQTIEELLNVRLVVEAPPKASYDDKKQILIATDDMPDIMLVSLDDVKRYARDDMFVNLSEHKDEMPNLFAHLESDPSFAMLTVDGSYYHAPTIQRLNPDARRSGQLVNIRTDLLAKYNLAVPTTFDELLTAIQTIQASEPGLIGMTNRKGGSTTGTRKLLDCMGYPLGAGSDMYYDEDLGGVWLYGPASENFKAVLAYLNKAYEAGVLDPDYATMTKDLWVEKLSSGQAICTMDNDGVVRNFNTALATVDPGYMLDVIPTLTNTLGQTRNFHYNEDWLDQAWVISSSSKITDVCIKFLDWCFSDQGADVNGYGKEGVTFDYVNGVPVIKRELLEEYGSGANASYDIQSAIGVGLLDIAPYCDTGAQNQMEIYMMGSDEAIAAFRALVQSIAADPGLRDPVLTPPLSAEQTERYNELHIAVQDYVYQEIDKYITGQEPIANYDAVIAHARSIGAEEMEQIYNDAWNAVLGE
ncbi:MAG: extracellular solute-binding protein [Clostridiales bacterium]|nr:extracellular solute-binding protein [Clostridiales bacterium]